MKLKKFAFLLALSAIWSLQSCDNNDDESHRRLCDATSRTTQGHN